MMAKSKCNSQSGYALLESAGLMLLLTPAMYFATLCLQSLAQESDIKDAVTDLAHTSLTCSLETGFGRCEEENLVEKIEKYKRSYRHVGCGLLVVSRERQSDVSDEPVSTVFRRVWGDSLADNSIKAEGFQFGELLETYLTPSGTGLHQSRRLSAEAQVLRCVVCTYPLVERDDKSTCSSALGIAKQSVSLF
jgi:hypothetical protein